jgi:LacI family transcriptional regulator
MSESLRIALLIESSRTTGRRILQGIAAYARTHGPWTFFHEHRTLDDPVPPRLRQWKPHGVIFRLLGYKPLRQIRRLGAPAVDLFHDKELLGIPGVNGDHEGLARLAINHFLERGLKNFAYCGLTNMPFSELRGMYFNRFLSERGFRATVFSYPGLPRETPYADGLVHAMQYADRLVAWLRNLPKPTGLLVCDDDRARQVLTLCNESGIVVPDEVAVLGVDNDNVECELCTPPLSSVNPNFEQFGFQAAALLDRLMKGSAPPKSRILIPPLCVVARRSTDILTVTDTDAAEAIRFVRDHACKRVSIEEITKHLCASQRTVQRWFRKHLGHSISSEIIRIQVEQVQELLRTTAMTLEEISQVAGFAYVESMQRIFKRIVGMTPGQYRKQTRYSVWPTNFEKQR